MTYIQKNDFKWYVVQAKAHQGDIAERELRQQNYEVFHARIACERIRGGKRMLREEPLFPGYMFIHLSASTSNWGPLRSTYGVSRIVSFGNTPMPVPDAVIDAIRARAIGNMPAFSRGDAVRIVDGPWQAIDSVFDQYDGNERAFLFLKLLGSEQRLSFPLGQIRLQAG